MPKDTLSLYLKNCVFLLKKETGGRKRRTEGEREVRKENKSDGSLQT